MAGLVCAARARQLGLSPRLVEKGSRPGGSMYLSSCVVWRHLDFDDFRRESPGGDEALQQLIWERLDDALDWLVSLGAEPVWQDTENPRTTGKRFDPKALTALLARDVELETPLPAEVDGPLVLCDGGFGKRFAEERGLLLRANPWSDGAGLDYALPRGGATTAGMEQFYGRVMPAPPARIREEDFVPLAQLYGREARVLTDDGRDITPPRVAWHENDLAKLIGPSAWYVVDARDERPDRGCPRRGRHVVEEGAPPARVAVHVAAGVTHTVGGLASTRTRASPAPTASGPPASTPAASPPAAMRAGSPRRSSSASPRPRRAK